MECKANPGAWLKKKREQENLTQESLAQLTGLKIRDIRRLEAHDLKIGCSKIVALAEYFRVSVDEILYGEGHRE